MRQETGGAFRPSGSPTSHSRPTGTAGAAADDWKPPEQFVDALNRLLYRTILDTRFLVISSAVIAAAATLNLRRNKNEFAKTLQERDALIGLLEGKLAMSQESIIKSIDNLQKQRKSSAIPVAEVRREVERIFAKPTTTGEFSAQVAAGGEHHTVAPAAAGAKEVRL